MANQIREQRSGIKPMKEDKEAVEREDIRKDREKERRRDRAIQRAAPEKRTQLQKEKERDISEKIALGLPNTGYNTGEIQYDSRLFNSSKGLDTGFGEEDAYSVYDKPWRETEAVKNAIYRPSKNLDKEYGDDFEKALGAKRFVPDKGFEGAEKTGSRADGPVAFEKHQDANFDPFKIDDFLGNLKKSNTSDSKRKQEEDDYGHKKSHKSNR